ncbi:SpoIIE family protein phosphatase [Flavobacterium sp. AG291]|uniref:SpoIIE family protein phosphatase n=1 Tax=Flavobacterium sp. AG291 TaxID=2184000 RepID=UPI000E0C1B87|nr:SpoIIE family protein phosphatase [Flavobacterium sp. AG291]RDI14570.1 anti-sigma regulatory factor (Ser/Thr protein kinase) [Flavobacterium sp. AG291]
MADKVLLNYKIDDRSYVSYVKREIHTLVVGEGFSSQKVGEIDIVVSELTSNLVKFAEEGELLYRVSSDENGPFFEIYCIDNGKGISNLARMRQDGISTSDTLGQGLGAIERLSHTSSVFTNKGWGTLVHSKIYAKDFNPSALKKNIDIGAVQVCCPGEKVCGDGYAVKRFGNGYQFFMGDGLGHGINAHEAAEEAIKAFKDCKEQSPSEVLRYINQQVKKTRGLVATVVYLDFEAKKWMLCGIGNISTSIYTGLSARNYTPYNGIIGHNIPRTINDSVQDLEKYQTLIMHSDGLRTRWNLSELAGILKFDPNVIAAVLYKDNARHNDDMTVFAAKINL